MNRAIPNDCRKRTPTATLEFGERLRQLARKVRGGGAQRSSGVVGGLQL